MPLRLRRGTEQERLTITPAEGEPIYVTDTQKLYIGDGTTVGGNQLSGSGDLGVGALEITADLPLNGFNLLGEDSKVIYDSSTDALTVSSITADLTGSVFADDSTPLIDGANGSIISPKIKGDIQFIDDDNSLNATIEIIDNQIYSNSFATRNITLTNPRLNNDDNEDAVTIGAKWDTGILSDSIQLQIGSPYQQATADSFVKLIGEQYEDSFGDAQFTKLSLGGIYDIPETLDLIQPEGKGELFRWEAAYLKELDVDGNGIFSGTLQAAELIGRIQGSIFSADSTLLVDADTGSISTGIITLDSDTISSPIQINLNTPLLVQSSDIVGTNYEIRSITSGLSGPGITYNTSRGTTESPEVALAGDILSLSTANGFDGSNYSLSSALVQLVDPNGNVGDSSNNVPGQIALVTFENGDVENPRGLYVDRRGWVTIGRSLVYDAEAVLDIDGDVKVTGLIDSDLSGSVFGEDSTTLLDAINNVISTGNLNIESNILKTSEVELIIDGIDRAISTPIVRQYSNIASINHITTGLTDGASAPGISYETSRGTVDSPSAVQNGDLLNVILAQPYDGTQYALSGALVMQVDPNGAITSGDVPTQLSLVNFADGNPLTPEGLSVNRKGWVSIGRSATHDALANLDVDGDVLITGNLTIQGTTTAVDSNNTSIKDNLIVLNQGESGAGITLGTAGIEIDRGTESAVSFVYNDSVDKWTLGSETLVAGTFEGSGSFTSVNINGVFDLPTTDGTAGQVLTTDGLGNTSWTTVSSGGTATSLDGDVKGSVFSDDSTLMIDGVRAEIVGPISTASDIELNGNNINNVLNIQSENIVHNIGMSEGSALTLGSTGGIVLTGAASANIQIGNSTSGTVTLGSGSNTVDFVSGTTVDFANTTVNNLPIYPTRNSASGTTSASHADGTDEDLDLTGHKGYALLKIQIDDAAWVRIYTSDDARSKDDQRLETTDPAPDAGVIAEVITTGAETVLISPGAFGFNDENTPTTTIPVAVRNKSGVTKSITVTLTILQMEA